MSRMGARVLWPLFGLIVVLGWSAPGLVRAQADCTAWNTLGFFESATAQDVQRCLAAGANLEARDEYGFTPLHVAAQYGTPETVGALLDAGAKAKARTEHGSTAFDLATFNDEMQGTEVYWRLNTDCTALNMREFFESATAQDVQRCLAAGADLDARAENGFTPLHWAARYGTPETVEALLDAGANAKARTMNWSTAFDLAKLNDEMQGTEAYRRLNEARNR